MMTAKYLFFIRRWIGWWLLVAAPVAASAKDRWIKVQSGHFMVISQGSESVTKQWAAELAQFQRGLQAILPVAEERLRPVTVILFKSDREFRPFKPREKGKPQNIAGLFAKTQDCQAIALSLDYDPDELRRVVYHETVHWHTSAADRTLPPWLDEGLAEVYATFKAAKDGSYKVGDTMMPHLRFLARSKAMPLEKLTTVARGSLSYNDGDRTSLFYAQSWAFVHYLLFGEDTPGFKSVVKYLDVSERAPSMEAAFTAAFGGDYATLDGKLEKYLRGGTYSIYTYRQKEVPAPAEWTVSAVQSGEVELALGILLLGMAERRVDAEAYLRQAAVLRSESPEVWQALGEAALLNNNQTEASENFQRAVERGSTSYFVHYGLGVTRIQGESRGGAAFGSGEAIYAARHFRRAIDLNPHFLPAYEGLGGVLPALDKVEAGDAGLLARAWKLSNNRGPLELGLAVCEFKNGDRARARARLEALSADATISSDINSLARAMLKDDEWTEFCGNMEKLFAHRNYREIVASIDRIRGGFSEPRYAQTLALNRDRAENYAILAAAVELLNDQKSSQARPILMQLQDHSDLNIRSEARRLIALIDKRGL